MAHNQSPLSLLFIADPLERFKPHKETTYAMMREASRRGHKLFACQPQDIRHLPGLGIRADVLQIKLTGSLASDWYEIEAHHSKCALERFDASLMRKDPPFDSEFFYTTHLLSQAHREGARIINHPQALRDHPEKLAILEFSKLCPETLVSKNDSDIRAFHSTYGDIILKPLDGMGGRGIFRVPKVGMNLGAIIETLTHNGQESIMVQRYLPEIEQGDKRILLINGQVVPFALARIPQGAEVRGNLAAGGKGVAQPLSESDKRIAHYLAPLLAQRGLFLVGLDVIGDKLTEINVTSPTGFQEIENQTGFQVAELFMRELENTIQG